MRTVLRWHSGNMHTSHTFYCLCVSFLRTVVTSVILCIYFSLSLSKHHIISLCLFIVILEQLNSWGFNYFTVNRSIWTFRWGFYKTFHCIRDGGSSSKIHPMNERIYYSTTYENSFNIRWVAECTLKTSKQFTFIIVYIALKCKHYLFLFCT